MGIKKIETELSGVYILEPQMFGDHRGWFMETWSEKNLRDVGIQINFVQDNHSFTAKKGTLRGLHFQQEPMAQAKLVRVIKGAVIDVAVDIRKGSPTYCKWIGVELSAENRRQLFLPRGFAHAFITLTDDVEFLYKCDNLYNRKADRGIRYDDPAIGVNWGIKNPILSDKDAAAPLLKDSDCNFIYLEGN